MDSSTKDKISRHVSRSFPEMRGVRPTVRRQRGGNHPQFLLVYKGQADLPGGRHMMRIVRVVADDRGSILRMSTSR